MQGRRASLGRRAGPDLQEDDPTARAFLEIYEGNLWGSSETVSGPGSERTYAAGLAAALPALFKAHSISSVFDAPCGDLNWMRGVVAKTGVDIVAPLIARLAPLQGKRMQLAVGDIRRMEFPPADLWICRDCWFHLSYADIAATMERFLASATPYILTTSHINDGTFANADCSTGGFRLIDLFSPPFGFPREALASIDDWVAPWPPRRMHLWHRAQLARAVSNLGAV